GELLAIVAADEPLLGKDSDLRDDRIARAADGNVGGDPAADELVLIGIKFHAFAAGVSDAAARLEKQQAVFRRGEEDAPAARLLHQRLIIELRHEAEQREREAVLPARLAVAAARIAAELREDRHDLVGEV